jgi:signal transduction histidine kinase
VAHLTESGSDTRQIRLSAYAVIAILAASAVAAMISSTLYGEYYASISSEWRQLTEQREAKVQLLADLRSQIGYGGAIHNFKNLVLRGHESLLGALGKDFAASFNSIEQYRALDLTAAETEALDTILQTLHDYQDRVTLAVHLRSTGADIATIDGKVAVDDTGAIAALALLEQAATNNLVNTSQRVQKLIEDGVSLSRIGLFLMLLPLVGGIATFVFVTMLLKEIRLRMLAEQQAYEASQARAEFLATVSHEIRTPMTGVLGIAEMLDKTKLDAEQKKLVKHIRDSGTMLHEIVNDVLDQSKITAGKLTLEEIAFELRSVPEMAVSMFRQQADEKRLTLAFEYDESLPQFISGDPTRLRQVLFNLLGNAFKFTRHGSVTLKVSHQGRDVRFDVQDTGKGIDKASLASLFDPFTQANTSVSREYGGTGLGLTISKSLIEMMGGEVKVVSEPEKGSTFSFTMPLRQVDAPEAADKPANTLAIQDLGSLKILVAEDVEINQIILESLLEDEGHICTFANHGGEALEAIEADDYDLVLMDIRMPKVDGIKALKAIRSRDDAKRELPVIALTADVAEGQLDTFLQEGFDEVASKPVVPERLLGTIAEVMRKQRERINS